MSEFKTSKFKKYPTGSVPNGASQPRTFDQNFSGVLYVDATWAATQVTFAIFDLAGAVGAVTYQFANGGSSTYTLDAATGEIALANPAAPGGNQTIELEAVDAGNGNTTPFTLNVQFV